MDEPQRCYRHPDRETRLACSECGRPICYECMTPAPVGQRCPEHSGRPQGLQKVTRVAERAARGDRWSVGLVTRTLIAINVLVYAAELLAGGTINGTGNWIYEHGALVRSACCYADGSQAGVANGEWWRLVTSMFLHYGPFHLAVNMFALYLFGTPLEHILGRWRFALLYVVSGIAGSAGALVVTPDALTAGASGAIFGVLGALFVLERTGTISTGGQLLMIIILNLVITFSVGGISIGGHVGGLIGGMAAMVLLQRFRGSVPLSLATLGGVAAISVVVAYAAI